MDQDRHEGQTEIRSLCFPPVLTLFIVLNTDGERKRSGEKETGHHRKWSCTGALELVYNVSVCLGVFFQKVSFFEF